MAYKDFTLETVVDRFHLKLTNWDRLFDGITAQSPSPWLSETLNESLALGVESASEKARSEFIVAPILLYFMATDTRTVSA